MCVVAGVRGKFQTKGKTVKATKDAVWRCGLRGHVPVLVGVQATPSKHCMFCGGKIPGKHARVLTGAVHAVDVVTTTVVGICGGVLSLVALACILHMTGVTL